MLHHLIAISPPPFTYRKTQTTTTKLMSSLLLCHASPGLNGKHGDAKTNSNNSSKQQQTSEITRASCSNRTPPPLLFSYFLFSLLLRRRWWPAKPPTCCHYHYCIILIYPFLYFELFFTHLSGCCISCVGIHYGSNTSPPWFIIGLVGVFIFWWNLIFLLKYHCLWRPPRLLFYIHCIY